LPTVHFFFFTHTPTTEFYTLSLHDALPISKRVLTLVGPAKEEAAGGVAGADGDDQNEVAFAETALRNGVAQPERDRGGSGVAVFVDVDHHFGIVHAEARLGRADDAQIGLVRD